MTVDQLETPAPLIDLDIVERNIAAAQAFFTERGIALRPHIKTHKLVRLAKAQITAGAVGITCQKTTEAEPFVDGSCDDILITYNILGREKRARLKSLADRARMTVVADNDVVVAGLAETFTDTARPLRVLVECDTGHGRCGVRSPRAAAELAGLIARTKGLTFGGLMTYPAPDTQTQVEAFLAEARKQCVAAAGACDTISSGGTPSMSSVPHGSVITEYRAGTYIYNDRSLVARGACTLDQCAMTITATVVSRPTTDRAILDAGSKTLSSDLLGLEGYGMLPAYPDAIIRGLSEEHGSVELTGLARKPSVGEIVAIIPNHTCVVTNLFDHVHLHRSGVFVETARVDARGCVR